MIPTLLVGDHIFVNKFIYGIRMPFTNEPLIPVGRPDRGDIVVFRYPEDRSKDYIKRVVAVEGDVVQMKNRKIYVNGKLMEDPHAVYTDPRGDTNQAQKDFFGPIAVPPGKFFVMGDNRDNSYDSRYWGFVDFNDLRGRAFIIYWSWNPMNHDVRWSRIGRLLH